MNLTKSLGATLRFDEFWRWLREHSDCILEAGTTSATLIDFDDYHWVFLEEEGQAVVQMRRGKDVVGELLINPAEVLFVEGALDVESGSQSQWIFEAMCGTKEEPAPAWFFLMAHGMEDSPRHKVLQH